MATTAHSTQEPRASLASSSPAAGSTMTGSLSDMEWEKVLYPQPY